MEGKKLIVNVCTGTASKKPSRNNLTTITLSSIKNVQINKNMVNYQLEKLKKYHGINFL